MKAKLLMIFLILISLTVAGCVDDTGPVTEEETTINDSENETVTEDTDEVPENESVTEETVSEEEDEEEKLEVIEYEGPKSYTIYMRNFNLQPKNLTIATGDTVIWFNDNDPVRTFTLISNEGLWEDANIVNRKNFRYTFNESGTYTYKVLTWEAMKGTIIVK